VSEVGVFNFITHAHLFFCLFPDIKKPSLPYFISVPPMGQLILVLVVVVVLVMVKVTVKGKVKGKVKVQVKE
jgi:hypothetical protein